MITIVVAYQKGTPDILATCLHSIARHTAKGFKVLVLTIDKDHDAADALKEVEEEYPGFPVEVFIVSGEAKQYPAGSRIHGAMLDAVIPEKIDTEYALTLDSDCFPVADDWLDGLLEEMKDPSIGAAGILHPWIPPPDDLPKSTTEWRVRSQHCWETTHVACQLVRVKDWHEDMKYVTGDDTGLDVVKHLRSQGKMCSGYMLTRCANPDNEEFDAEFNRHVCLIFGDKVYHHGGFSRSNVFGDVREFESFGWVEDLVLTYRGAEFLLNDLNSYKYQFDREEEVAADKMQRLFGLHSQRRPG